MHPTTSTVSVLNYTNRIIQREVNRPSFIRGLNPPTDQDLAESTQILTNKLRGKRTPTRQRDRNPCQRAFRDDYLSLSTPLEKQILTSSRTSQECRFSLTELGCRIVLACTLFMAVSLSQQSGSDPIRDSGWIVHTLEVYT